MNDRGRPRPGVVRSLVQSQIYQRTRVGIGLTCSVLGISIIVRTFAAVGLTLSALPPYVMGLALVALGAVRLRDYRTMSRMAADAKSGVTPQADVAAKAARPRR